MKTYSAFDAPVTLHGLLPTADGFLRLPADVAASVNDGTVQLNNNTTGGRLRFATDSRTLHLSVTYAGRDFPYPNMPVMAQSGFDLYADGEGGSTYCGTLVTENRLGEDCRAFCDFSLPEGMRDYTLFFPMYGGVKELSLGFDDGAQVAAHRPYRIEKPVVFYGSSITHGASAGRPGNCYPAILSRWLDAEFLNLGFSGSAKGEQTMAQYIAGLDMSVFVMDYDHNAPTVEHLAETHEPFFRTIRAAHPDLPVVMVSRPVFYEPLNADEKRDGELRREIVRKTYQNAVAAGDKNVAFVDGGTFADGVPAVLRDTCTQDSVHPTDAGFALMAQSIGAPVRAFLERAAQ